MNKLAASILFGAGLMVSACTVHHYHHQVPAKGAHSCEHHGDRGHGSKGHRGMPEGHPPVDGQSLPEGHPPVDGHGMKGHHGMPEGHPPVDGHGMKGHHGMPEGHGSKMGSSSEGDGHAMKEHAELPAPVAAFHDSFAAVWHEESDAVRSTAACAKFREWETLALGVSEHKAQRDQAVAFAAATKDLNSKIKVVADACRKKKASVQVELTAAHDALHAVVAALAK